MYDIFQFNQYIISQFQINNNIYIYIYYVQIKKKQMYSKKLNVYNESWNSSKPKYFTSGKEHFDSSYRKINNRVREQRNMRYNSKFKEKHDQSTTLNINNMRRELEQLGKFISSTDLASSQLESKQLIPYDSIQNKKGISNISPIYNYKKRKIGTTPIINYNQKLDTLIKRLNEISQSIYFSPQKPRKKPVKLKPHEQKCKQQSKSLNSKRIDTSNKHLANSIFEYSKGNRSKEYHREENKEQILGDTLTKQTKSIFFVPNVHNYNQNQSDRTLINNYLYNTSGQDLYRNFNYNNNATSTINHIFKEQNDKHTSSIQWYLFEEKLLKKKNLPLYLNVLKQWKPHRARITNIVLQFQEKCIYTSSLDYSVVKTSYQDDYQLITKHRGGVDSLFVQDSLVLSGGRDCYLRSNNDWSIKFPSRISQILSLNKQTILLKSDNKLIEFDLQKRIQKQTCLLPYGSQFLQSIDKQIFMAHTDSLFKYDSRENKLKKIFNLPDNIRVWKMSSKGKIIAVGKNVWVGNHIGMQEQYYLGDIGQEVKNIKDYYNGHLIQLINNRLILIDELGKQGEIRISFDQQNWNMINSSPLNSSNHKVWMVSREGGLRLCVIR